MSIHTPNEKKPTPKKTKSGHKKTKKKAHWGYTAEQELGILVAEDLDFMLHNYGLHEIVTELETKNVSVWH